MKSSYKFNLTLILSVVAVFFFSATVLADWRDDAKVINVSGGDMFFMESLLTESILDSDDDRPSSIELMIPDVTASLEAMPDSLYSKVEKFYAVKPCVRPDTAPQASLEEILEWIDELWESGVMKEAGTTYAEYIEFREAIKESASLY
jgi:hypothetical protein